MQMHAKNNTQFEVNLSLSLGTGESIDERLAHAKLLDPDWFWHFENSRLAIANSADLAEVSELISSAPSEWLAGYTAGLFVNN